MMSRSDLSTDASILARISVPDGIRAAILPTD